MTTDTVLEHDTGAANGGSVFRQPNRHDGAAIHELIAGCPPLDLNSVYAYLLLAEHFDATSVVVEGPEGLDGYISAYVPPGKPDVLFVWQVAVHPRARGQSLGKRMVRFILQQPGLQGVRYIETTVGPSNAASRGMFQGIANMLQTTIDEAPLFEQHMFGGQGHEDEPVLRIGPFSTPG